MKTVILLGVIVLQSLSYLAATQNDGSFAIYLFASPVDTRSVKQQQWNDLPLATAPLISETDIIAYDFSKHALKLKPEALKRLPRPPVEGTPFVVVVNGQRIYGGAFYSNLSSIPFSLPVIIVRRGAQSETPAGDIVLIEKAYPAQSAMGKDLRSDERVRDVLGKLNKLAPL